MRLFLISWKKYKNLIVFLFLELVAIGLLVSVNSYQNSYFFQVTTSLRSDVLSTMSAVTNYFHLEDANKKLLKENRQLVEQLKNINIEVLNKVDTLKKYRFQTAQISYGTLGASQNYFVINKGKKQGIETELAVTSSSGLVGIIYQVTDDYASVMPLINTSFSCLISIADQTLTASTSWDGKDYRFIKVKGVPLHLKIEKNDSVFTNRNSTLYPPHELIGTVISINKEDLGRSYALKVKLATNFATLKNVYIVKNKDKQQIDSLLNNE